MKQSNRKMTRGQMVYAPINATDRSGRSPFGKARTESGKSLVREENAQEDKQQQQFMDVSEYRNRQQVQPTTTTAGDVPSPYHKPSQQSNSNQPCNQPLPQQHQQPLLPSSPQSPEQHQQHQQLQQLSKQNQLLRSRQQIYLSKLLKLQQGLHRQHEQFMNLQQLYTQLFNVYKQKQEEFAELQMKYKQTERSFNNGYESFRQFAVGQHNHVYTNNNSMTENSGAMNGNNNSNNSGMYNVSMNQPISANKHTTSNNSINASNDEITTFRQQLTQLIYQNKRLNQTNEKLITELNYIKSKQTLNSSKLTLENKFITQIADTQKLLQQEKESKLQLEYQNKYLQMRNEDLEKTVAQLENIIMLKQTEIIKIRQEKIHVRKQSAQKIVNKSPPKQDSARSKSSNNQKKFNKLIDNLQKQNHRLREQNLKLRQKLKSTLLPKQPTRTLSDSHYTTNSTPMGKRLDFGQSSQKYAHTLKLYQPQSSLRHNYQNENFNSQNINQQYFSFSRQSDDKLSEEELPSFPVDLQIEGIIRKHQEANGRNNRPILMEVEQGLEEQQGEM